MNKYAAEKIAQEYYELGAQLAVDNMVKTANPLLVDVLKGGAKAARGAKAVQGPAQFARLGGGRGAFNLAEFQRLQNAPTGGRARGLSRVPADQYNEVVRNLSSPNALSYLEANPKIQGYLQSGYNRSGLTELTPMEMLRNLPGRHGVKWRG